jgi:outer membrane protein TolC
VQSTGTGAQKLSFPEKTMASGENNAPVKQWYAVDDPWLRQTRQNLSSLEKTLVNEEHKTDSNIQAAWFNVDKNKRELDLFKNLILELSKSALDVSTREYESGTIAFSEAIDSYTSWLKVKLLIAQKQRDLGVAVAKLENITGKSF